ncbi:hypothetical protein XELAEV_18017169mg [Xenopus laevis]|uniref:Interleukin-4 n=1 Tax=Xenopus laevis TaxID=8355 RepID=A0A974DBZ4_XENLA|nr:hypothetical protein XELAEV_18017169mg [Xenopus laevis]
MQILRMFLLCAAFGAFVMCKPQSMVEIEEFEKEFYPFLVSSENNSLAKIMVLKRIDKHMIKCKCASAQLKHIWEYVNKSGDPSSIQVKKMLTMLDSLIAKTPSNPLTENKCQFNGLMPHQSKNDFQKFFKRFNENDCSPEARM